MLSITISVYYLSFILSSTVILAQNLSLFPFPFPHNTQSLQNLIWISCTFSFFSSFSDDHLLLKSSVLSYSPSSQGLPWHTPPQVVHLVTQLCAGNFRDCLPLSLQMSHKHLRCNSRNNPLRILYHPNSLFLLAWNDFFKVFSFLFLGLNVLSKPQKPATPRACSNLFIILPFYCKGRRSTYIFLMLITHIKRSMSPKSAVISAGQLRNPSSLNCCFCCRQLAIFPHT